MAKIIDGKKIASQILEEVSSGVNEFRKQTGISPGLAVVLIGEDPASQIYVRNKVKSAREVGLISIEYRLPADSSQQVVDQLIDKLNRDDSVHGILVQLPLPEHLNANSIIDSINPKKDVDGFHPLNTGTLFLGRPTMIPCTPQGCLIMLKQLHSDMSGKNAVVIGCSNIVGKPMGSLLLQENCSVTLLHKYSHNIPQTCAQADIVIVAVGQSEMVKADWIKPGATVLDVGINAIEIDGVRKLTGDVDFEAVKNIASAISPVPGGVGPMTIACLMKNTLEAAYNLYST